MVVNFYLVFMYLLVKQAIDLNLAVEPAKDVD